MREARKAGERAVVCPACGRPVDAIRAGEVAILGGEFTYFCDQACKARHVASLATALLHEAATEDPPRAQPAAPDRVIKAEVLPRTEPSADLRAAEPIDTSLAGALVKAPPHARRRGLPKEEDGDSIPAPVALSEPALRPSARPTEGAALGRLRQRLAGAREALSTFAMAAGVLSWAVALLGPPAHAARLPLASIATAGFLLRVATATDGRPRSEQLLVTIPPVVVYLVAVAHAVRGLPAGIALASTSGLASAAGLLQKTVIERMSSGVLALRRRLGATFDVPALREGSYAGTVSADELRPGDVVAVEAGERVPADGVVASGEALVEPFWGAASIVKKQEGDAVVGGGRIREGRLRVTVVRAGVERAVLRHLQSDATRLDLHTPSLVRARTFALLASPLSLAFVGAAAYAGGTPPLEALAAGALALLGLAAPVALAAAAAHHGRAESIALEHGVLIRDPAAFDKAGRTDVAVLCSRGTVLTGEPEIVGVHAIADASRERILSLAAAAESVSQHPVALAVQRAARAERLAEAPVKNITETTGLGVSALLDDGRLVVGGRALLLSERISVAIAEDQITLFEAQGKSVLLVAVADRLVGLIALQDGLKAGARAAVQRLLDARVEPVLMSGEAAETCRAIARALDIDHVRPEIVPVDRGTEVQALAEGGHVVAVIGRAGTDDVALRAAAVPLPLGAAPLADWPIAIVEGDVRDAAATVALARSTREKAIVSAIMAVGPGTVSGLAIAFGLAGAQTGALAGSLAAVAAFLNARR